MAGERPQARRKRRNENGGTLCDGQQKARFASA
jgi:hypothetical protein